MDAELWRGASAALAELETRYYDRPNAGDRWVQFLGAPASAWRELQCEADRAFYFVQFSGGQYGRPLEARILSWDFPEEIGRVGAYIRQVMLVVASRLEEHRADDAVAMSCARSLRDACREVVG